jgi:hypothetical protein
LPPNQIQAENAQLAETVAALELRAANGREWRKLVDLSRSLSLELGDSLPSPAEALPLIVQLTEMKHAELSAECADAGRAVQVRMFGGCRSVLLHLCSC